MANAYGTEKYTATLKLFWSTATFILKLFEDDKDFVYLSPIFRFYSISN